MRTKKFHKIARHTKEPPFVKLVFIQPCLAMALAEHTGIYDSTIGHIVGNALSDIAEDGKHYEHLKQNPDLIVDMIQLQLEKLGYRYDKEKLREMVRTAVEKAGKIVDKLYDKYQEDHLKAFRTALKADNPFPVLKQAGIDIEPELEEFREFLAEISGKKIEKKPKSPETKKVVGEEIPSEVLAIAKALEFSDFSKGAMKKAETELLKLIDRFINENNAQAVFHAVKLLRLVQKGEVERIKRFGG